MLKWSFQRRSSAPPHHALQRPWLGLYRWQSADAHGRATVSIRVKHLSPGLSQSKAAPTTQPCGAAPRQHPVGSTNGPSWWQLEVVSYFSCFPKQASLWWHTLTSPADTASISDDKPQKRLNRYKAFSLCSLRSEFLRKAKSSAIISITNNTHRHSEKHLKFSKQNGSVTHCVFSEELSYYVHFISWGECQRKEFREPHKRRQQSHTRCPPAHCCNPA